MGFLDALRNLFRGGQSRPADRNYWVYVQCRRCGEPIRARIDLLNELSHTDDGEAWTVTKGIMGSGAQRCFQTIEVTLTFSQDRSQVLDRQISGGKFITAEEYEALLNQPPVSDEA